MSIECADTVLMRGTTADRMFDEPSWAHRVEDDAPTTLTEKGDPVTLEEIYKAHAFVLSFELFPPKSDVGMENLASNLEDLLRFHPNFITCTYGAGGSTQDKTLATLARVQEMCALPLASHLTCVDATQEVLKAYLQAASDQGIQNIVAIRGDAPAGAETFTAVSGGLSYGNELVALIRSEFPQFGIAVGGYPEVHTEATSGEDDLAHLKRKVDAGADVIITQLFYDNEDFFTFREKCRKMGIDKPIVPGILPITSYGQIKRITTMCGAKLPPALGSQLERFADDPEGQYRVGVDHAIEQVGGLRQDGIPGIHFYVLNKSQATAEVLSAHHLPPQEG